ncbi:hypothetical protein LTSERUB_5222 [Salmonella enterica subsp. enterica serovar Rubislaw str. A4-653]|uniref:Uncharacterized protein n=1 Tax=Salmonella enterica subsp. enterica serovar Rubislaw str. A4-653 TaxID=913081 RepID=G5QQ80_SALRU|nr:hypothetical protein LTSERUB_5222 [Salmonella enterica subsp. enterica serovar Rubislaw str. A4-653]
MYQLRKKTAKALFFAGRKAATAAFTNNKGADRMGGNRRLFSHLNA